MLDATLTKMSGELLIEVAPLRGFARYKLLKQNWSSVYCISLSDVSILSLLETIFFIIDNCPPLPERHCVLISLMLISKFAKR